MSRIPLHSLNSAPPASRSVLEALAQRSPSGQPINLHAQMAHAPAVLLGCMAMRKARLNHLPVLLMWGDKDPVYEFLPRFQRIFPDAQTLTIPGAHHFPFAEAPDQMIAEIRHWWRLASVASESTRRVS